MPSAIVIEGFEDLEEYIQEMTLTENDKKTAMKAAIEPIGEEVRNNTPVKSEKLKKSVRTQVKKEGFATVGIVKMGEFYGKFQEFGTSQQKAHVGFFERAVNKSQNKAIGILSKELLDKAK